MDQTSTAYNYMNCIMHICRNRAHIKDGYSRLVHGFVEKKYKNITFIFLGVCTDHGIGIGFVIICNRFGLVL